MLKLSDTLYVNEAQIGIIRCIPAHMTRSLPGDPPTRMMPESFIVCIGEGSQEIDGDAAVSLRAWLDRVAENW